ncbi:internalin, putative [hydrothermal vent metagenome]|uniref:Internalin, putative n=1 Tax=hydrothermal vent metagenome TaxID=652676 RepID=A0A1W1BP21_9ZZZZ
MDSYGKFTVYISPQTNDSSEIAKIDFVEINDNTNIDADLKLSEYADPTPLNGYAGENVSFYVRAVNDGPDASEANVVLKVSYNQDVIISSAGQVAGGTNFTCDITSGALSAGSFITCTRDTDFSASSTDQDFEFVVQPQSVGTLTQSAVIEGLTTNDPDTSNNTITSKTVNVADRKAGCPGVVMPTLDGTAVSAIDRFAGEDIAGYGSYYYHFTPTVEGKLDVIFDADQDFKKGDITIYDACNGNELAKDDKTVGDKVVTYDKIKANQLIIVKIYRDHPNAMSYDVDFNFTKVLPTPPNMGDVPNQTLNYGDSINLDLSTYVEMTNDDPILEYELTGTLPRGMSFDSATGIISGSASDVGTFDMSVRVRDKDGYSNSDNFTITVNIEVVENADALCYQDPPEYSGMMCMDMGMCKGGMGCKTTYNLKNDSNLAMDNVVVDMDETGMGGTFGSDCGVSPGGTCESKSNVDFGPVGMLGKATEYKFDDSIQPNDSGSAIWAKSMFSGSCFSGENLYGSYIQDNKLHRGKLKKCATVIAPPTNTDWKSGFNDFYLINPEDTRNIVGNYAVAGNTVTCLTKQQSGYGDGYECHGQNDYQFKTSNGQVNKYIDIDSDDRTWDSTSSYIVLPEATYDPEQGILWAGLFWQGRIVDETRFDMHYGLETTDGYKWVETGTHQINYHLSLTDAQVNRIKLKVDDGVYNDVTASKVFYYSSSDGRTYAAFSNVTDAVRSAALDKGKHTFTVANLTTNVGREATPGLFGGWSLVVIYAEDLNLGKPRNISIYNGFQRISDKVISIKGFRLPKSGDVTSQLTVFSGEGEYLYGYRAGRTREQDWMKISDNRYSDYVYMPGKSDGTEVGNKRNMFDAVMDGVLRDDVHDANNKRLYNAMQINNNGVDIDTYDVSEIMEGYRDKNKDINEVFIKLYSNNDYITTSMLAYSAELYIPKLCYDYTMDIDGYVLASKDNNISTPFGSFGKPLTTTAFMRSLEGDISLRDVSLTYEIEDIDQVKYTYPECSTEISENGKYDYTDGCPYTYGESAKGFNINIGEGKGSRKGDGGLIKPEESRYVSWKSNFQKANVDTKFKLWIDYTVDYGAGAVPLHQEFTEKDLCPSDNNGFLPKLGIFNVVDARKPYNIYNLYTQVTRRPFNLSVYFYDANDPTQLVDTNDMHFPVGVEAIRADNFIRDANTACEDEKSKLPGITTKFALFNGSPKAGIHYEADDVNISYRSVAMRVWYLTEPDGVGDTIVNNHNCTDTNMDGDLNSPKDIGCIQLYERDYKPNEQKCNTECRKSFAWTPNRSCYTCLRKYYGKKICSRDNFAIRPEAFVISILDSGESTDTTKPSNKLPTETKDPDHPNPAHAIAGYKYRFDINATSHTCRTVQVGMTTKEICDEPVGSYVQHFEPGSPIHRAKMWWHPNAISIDQAKANCVDTEEKNITINIFGGTNVNYAAHTSYVDSVPQIGEYRFEIFDENWTSADWSDDEMLHHTNSAYSQYYEGGDDCIGGDDGVLPAGNVNPNRQNGCKISSHHTNVDNGREYYYHDTRYYPYKFDLTSLTAQSGVSSSADRVYINTLSENDGNMSYNIQGIFKAVGKDGKATTNFVKGCYAEDVNLQLYQRYVYDAPEDGIKYPSYSITTYNKDKSVDRAYEKKQFDKLNTKSTTTIEPIEIFSDSSYFSKDMNGSMDIDLSLNFDRSYNLPLNPRLIHMKEFNVTLKSDPVGLMVDLKKEHKIEGGMDISRDISFQFARVKSSKPYYDGIVDSSVDTPISVVTYCNLGPITCNVLGINTDKGKTNEFDWYTNVDHNTTGGDGIITLVPNPSVADGATIDNSELAPISIDGTYGINEFVNVAAVVDTRPLEVDIDFDKPKTSDWLIYNPDANATPSPLYKVRFVSPNDGKWAGHGKTGNVVGGKVSEHKNRRLGW